MTQEIDLDGYRYCCPEGDGISEYNATSFSCCPSDMAYDGGVICITADGNNYVGAYIANLSEFANGDG